MTLYFVSARLHGDTSFAGHWLARNPQEAIAIAKDFAQAPDLPYEWKARKSKAKPEAMALNLRRTP